MIRRIVFGVLLAAFAGLLVYSYFKLTQTKKINYEYFEAIPYSSALVAEFREPAELFSRIQGTNLIYDELLSAGLIDPLDATLIELDTMLASDAYFQQHLAHSPVLLAWIAGGAEKFNFLISVRIPSSADEDEFEEKLSQRFALHFSSTTKTYDGATVSLLKKKGGEETYAMAFHNGYFLFSPLSLIIEESVRQLNSGTSLKDKPEFLKAYRTAGTSKSINLYVNHQEWARYVSSLLDPVFSSRLGALQNWASWSELDGLVKPNGLLFNGYSFASDSVSNFLSLFEGQKARSLDVTRVLPANTALFFHYGLSNFKDFYQARKNYLESGNQLVNHQKQLKQLDQSVGQSSQQLMESVCGSEIGLAILEVNAPAAGEQVSSLGGRAIGLIRLIDPQKLEESFRPLMVENDEGAPEIKEYRETRIYTLKPSSLLEVYLGSTFRVLENQYLMELDGFAVFGNKLSTMREVINAYKGNKTLDQDENFESFGDNLSSTANLTAYVNIARAPYLIHHFVAPKLRNSVKKQLELLRKFEGFCLQISHDQGEMFYNNLYFKHNPIYKKLTASLWEIPLDTTVTGQPYLFTNHYTRAHEVFIQDDNNKIYLISNTGRILWSRQLDEPMIGGIFEIDKYRNDKYQILFGTANRMYLIDRNGKDVDGFPIKFKASASAPIVAFDYDGNRKYRMMAPLSSGVIDCYDIQGKKVKGWKYKKDKAVKRRMTHLVVNKKDYIIAWQEDGRVRVLNRRGEDRLKLSNKLDVNGQSPLRTIIGKDLSQTLLIAADSSGNILRLTLADKLETAQYKHYGASHFFDLVDLNNDGKTEFLFLDEEGLSIYNEEGTTVLNYPLEEAHGLRPGIFSGSEAAYISLVVDSLSEVHLVDRFGVPIEGSPFFGQTRAQMNDLNLDGRLELVTCSRDGMVYCYVLN